MSTITYPTETKTFTLTLPLPNPFQDNYLEYTQHAHQIAELAANMSKEEEPRLQIIGENRTQDDSSYKKFVWSVSLFSRTDGFSGCDFPEEEALYTYAGDAYTFQHDTIAQLQRHVKMYGRLAITFDVEDTLRFIAGEPISIAENMPIHEYKGPERWNYHK